MSEVSEWNSTAGMSLSPAPPATPAPCLSPNEVLVAWMLLD